MVKLVELKKERKIIIAELESLTKQKEELSNKIYRRDAQRVKDLSNGEFKNDESKLFSQQYPVHYFFYGLDPQIEHQEVIELGRKIKNLEKQHALLNEEINKIEKAVNKSDLDPDPAGYLSLSR